MVMGIQRAKVRTAFILERQTDKINRNTDKEAEMKCVEIE